MPILPSIAHVARAIARSRSPDDWDTLPPPEQSANLKYARVALDAVWSWYQERRNPSNRYFIEPITDDKDSHHSYAIFDKNVGSNTQLGVVHDALLAQQIVDDLNAHDTKGTMPKAPSGD